MGQSMPLNGFARYDQGSSVCVNGDSVNGRFLAKGQALASALGLKGKFRAANVTVLDEENRRALLRRPLRQASFI